jgi:arsenite methyltransferase
LTTSLAIDTVAQQAEGGTGDVSNAMGATITDDLKLRRADQRDVASLVLGDSYLPGGTDLTRRLARALELRPGMRVADLTCGSATTAFLLACEFGVDVDGVDLGARFVARANAEAAELELDEYVTFWVGDTERLPFEDGSVDALISECAFCTFPDKSTAAAEMARVLRPGGRVGIADVALDPQRPDPALESLAGWVACLADARPVAAYGSLLAAAGLELTFVEAHDEALAGMIERVDVGLVASRVDEVPALEGVDVEQARERTAMAARAVRDGTAGYALMVAESPSG